MFGEDAERYDRARPSYPDEPPSRQAVETGAPLLVLD